MKALNFRKVH